VRARRVVSKETAARLRAFCRSVVEEGTGTSASLPFIQVAGKTGTAEIASPKGGYLKNRFVASFVGFAPFDDPKVVVLVAINEPRYAFRFGGVSAAPVFARINEAIANSSHLYDEVLSHNTIEPDEDVIEVFKAPNFLRCKKGDALELARRLEINAMCQGSGGEVVAQDPDPGVAMARDEVLRLYLGAQVAEGENVVTPDLLGLSMRLARREAVEAGFKVEVVGTGFVTSQYPRAGKATTQRVVKVYCKDKRGNG